MTKRSKHINLRYHTVRDHVKDLCYCPTGDNKADPLTKPLVTEKYVSMFKTSPCDDRVVYSGQFARAFYCTV